MYVCLHCVFLLLAALIKIQGQSLSTVCYNATLHHHHDKGVHIECYASRPFAAVVFVHNGVNVTDLAVEKVPVKNSVNASLYFNPDDESHRLGQYTVLFFDKEDKTTVVEKTEVYLFSSPLPGKVKVYEVEGMMIRQVSVTATEGNTVTLPCETIAYPAAQVDWYIAPPKQLDAKRPVEFGERLDMDNSSLVITNLQFDDRADYVCVSKNEKGNLTMVIQLRIRSRLAPLWPAVGIILELSLLGLYIFFAQMRDKKVQAARDAQDQQELENLGNNDDDTAGGAVRRKRIAD